VGSLSFVGWAMGLVVTVLGSGLVALDATVVNVAIPAIGQGFGAGLMGLQWIVNAYSGRTPSTPVQCGG